MAENDNSNCKLEPLPDFEAMFRIEPSRPGTKRSDKILRAIEYSWSYPESPTDRNGNPILQHTDYVNLDQVVGPDHFDHVNIIRVHADEVTESTKLEMLEELARKLSIPESWML